MTEPRNGTRKAALGIKSQCLTLSALTGHSTHALRIEQDMLKR